MKREKKAMENHEKEPIHKAEIHDWLGFGRVQAIIVIAKSWRDPIG
jgi:hypothetical protein